MNKKYTFVTKGNNQAINIPLELKWDFYGRDESIDLFEEDVIREVVGVGEDFEVLRFSHKPYQYSGDSTSLTYQFYFYSGDTNNVTGSTISDWRNSFIPEGFTQEEIYFKSKPFIQSFFKLDFYDTKNNTTQKNYFTIILPTYNTLTTKQNLSFYYPNVDINYPKIPLDFIPSNNLKSFKDGFFIYWLKSRATIDIDTFYMSVKFFDAKLGVFVRMMTKTQASLGSKYNFNEEVYFYLKVKLDYTSKTYEIFDNNDVRIGNGTPIKWYEYVNP